MTPGQRHYGLDWLRIGAFGLLIVYHVALVFSTWDWVIKSPVTYPQLIVPMALLTPWRLPLLFAVSGFASRKLFDKTNSVGAFTESRNRRLLIPWAFAMLAIIPPEMWVRALEQGYPHGFLRFWMVDYWSLHPAYGKPFPSWEHLWFIVYLWAYTMMLAVLLLIPKWNAARVTRAADQLTKGLRILWIPILTLVVLKMSVLFVLPEKQGLFTDWNAHLLYLPIFLFGFALGGETTLWPVIARVTRPAAQIAVAAGIVVTWIEVTYPGHEVPPHAIMALDRAARIAMAWGMILVLFQLATRFLNHDHKWRATLAEAVFPLYIAHHPAIVLIAWFTLPLHLDPFVEFALILAGTFAFATAFYLIGREFDLLRPLVGLAPRKSRQTVAPAAA